MSDSPHRAALIGLGFIGCGDEIAGRKIGQNVQLLDGTHSEALQKNPRVHLVVACDQQADRRDRFTQRTGIPCQPDWREVLAENPPEIVSVATNSPSHAEITIACAEAGVKAVYCEKPIATRYADGAQAIAACRQQGTLLAINHNRRFNPNYRRLRDFVATGELGELTSCNLQWGNGRLGNIATHLFDAVEMLTGRTIEAVSGTLDTAGKPDCRGAEYHDPGGWGVLRLSGGLMVTVDAADWGAVPVSLVLNGTKGRAVTGGGVVTIHRKGREEVWPSTRKMATSMDHAVAEIVAALDSGEPISYPPEIPLHIFEAITAFHISNENNAAWTPLPLTDEQRNREIRIG